MHKYFISCVTVSVNGQECRDSHQARARRLIRAEYAHATLEQSYVDVSEGTVEEILEAARLADDRIIDQMSREGRSLAARIFILPPQFRDELSELDAPVINGMPLYFDGEPVAEHWNADAMHELYIPELFRVVAFAGDELVDVETEQYA